MKSWLYYTCHPPRGHIVTLQCHVFPRVLSSLDTRRISLRQSYRAGLGGWEARSVTRDRESLRNGSYEVVPPPVQNVLLFCCCAQESCLQKISSLSAADSALSFDFRDPEDPGSPERAPLARPDVASSRQVRSPEACGTWAAPPTLRR